MQIVIIGGGVVGLNIALGLAQPEGCYSGSNNIFLLEQEKFLGHHTSTRNSEVIHAGFAYPPGSLKARLCVEGNRLTYALLDKLGVAYKKCGKWIIACSDTEAAAIAKVEENAKTCGVPDFKISGLVEFRKAEPTARNVKAVAFSATSGIMDAAAYIRTLEVELSKRKNVNIIYPCKVTGVDGIKNTLETTRGPIEYDLLINSAGLWADEIHAMTCRNVDFQMCSIYQIVPFKGEYYTWRKGRVQTMLYPVPGRFLAENSKSEIRNPKQIRNSKSKIQNGKKATLISSMGIHTHRNVAGELLVGPSQVQLTPDKKSDYSIQTPPEVFAKAIECFVDGIDAKDLEPAYAGNRPKLYKDGQPYGDFLFLKEGNVIHLLGIESPALTAAPAIAKYVKGLI